MGLNLPCIIYIYILLCFVDFPVDTQDTAYLNGKSCVKQVIPCLATQEHLRKYI